MLSIHKTSKLCLLALVFITQLSAKLEIPSIFGDSMVLQQHSENAIWGWADAGATVELLWQGQNLKTQADADGYWRTQLPTGAASFDTQKLRISSGPAELHISDILIGEVWLCSGQSNMQWTVSNSADAKLEKFAAHHPALRMITVPRMGTQIPQKDFEGHWQRCTPETVSQFSAVAYYFGRQLQQSLQVPIGLIACAYGGSAAEAWIERGTFENDPRFATELNSWKAREANFDYQKVLAQWREKVKKARANNEKAPRKPQNILTNQHRPGNLWAGMLQPIIGYGIRGTVWYQGESNAARANKYKALFSLMIREWRQAWGLGDFPFYWVQLADFKAESTQPKKSAWAELREAQTQTLALSNTGQAVIYDLGEGRDIHPRNKQGVGKRLARIALARDYGFQLPYLNPQFKSMAIEGDTITLSFEHVGSSLYTFDVKTAIGFVVAGEDKVWHPATARLTSKSTIEVICDQVPNPVAIRYAWADNPVANVYSREGLPLTPFRTDNWNN
jgi:sialate O-acetylesterase